MHNKLASFPQDQSLIKNYRQLCINALKRAYFISTRICIEPVSNADDVSMPLNGLTSFPQLQLALNYEYFTMCQCPYFISTEKRKEFTKQIISVSMPLNGLTSFPPQLPQWDKIMKDFVSMPLNGLTSFPRMKSYIHMIQ